ncbi:uncharacterized protein LOC123670555 isoform X2 [Harmonia axyridis]|uniref:uncharacterized protein LOC123670555 isoform X2 n=1 Tax=Harmonia axyridis TaxID=115357 RepID=UPI001E278B53|nr:uncharacterized protein LOC123670555 isoform X2 [Harmonia axyridis]
MDQQSANITNRTITPIITPISSNRGVLVIQATGKPKLSPGPQHGISNQGVATLIVMCCVLTIIMMFCCFAAPGIRDLCKRYVFRQCVIDDPEVNNVWTRRRELAAQHKIINEKQQQRRLSRSSEHRQSRRHSSTRRPL